MSKIFRILIDIILIVLLPVLVVFCFTGRLWHEWLGVGMAVAVLLHHVVNPSFFRNLVKGKYDLARFLLVVVNLAIMLDFLFLLVSGLSFSKFVMGWVDWRSLRPEYPEYFRFMRFGHVCACFWGVVLMGIHLGQHAQQMFGMLRLNKLPKCVTFLLTVAVLAVAAYGNYVFVADGWFDQLYAPMPHVFRGLDLTNGELLFDASAAVIFFALIGNLLQNAAKR